MFLGVNTCVCMWCVRWNVCMCLSLFLGMYACACPCLRSCTYLFVCVIVGGIYVFVGIYAYVCLCVRGYVCIFWSVCMFVGVSPCALYMCASSILLSFYCALISEIIVSICEIENEKGKKTLYIANNSV